MVFPCWFTGLESSPWILASERVSEEAAGGQWAIIMYLQRTKHTSIDQSPDHRSEISVGVMRGMSRRHDGVVGV